MGNLVRLGRHSPFGSAVFGGGVALVVAGLTSAIGGGPGYAVAAPTALIGGGLVTLGARLVRGGAARTAARSIDEAEEGAEDGSDATATTGPALLEVRRLDFSYGQVQVLFNVSLDVREGEVLALLGTNGAGKSTLLRAISGLGAPDAGVVRFAGRTITAAEPRDRVRLGIVQMPGGNAVFPSLSVRDNLVSGAYSFIWDTDRVTQRVDEVLDLFPSLADRLGQRAGTLSGGEQQMLGLAMGLLLEPKLLLIDELSLGLAPVVVQQLLDIVERLKATGLTMVIVEQSVNVALAVADRAVFMERGEVRFEGAAAELAGRDDLVRAVFLGSDGG